MTSRATAAGPARRAEAAVIFAALGDETRLKIVDRLCREGPLSIMTLTDGTTVSRQAITKHLHALEEAGLARGVRSGRESIWELRPSPLAETRRYLDQVAAQWDTALDRLRAFVEE